MTFSDDMHSLFNWVTWVGLCFVVIGFLYAVAKLVWSPDRSGEHTGHLFLALAAGVMITAAAAVANALI